MTRSPHPTRRPGRPGRRRFRPVSLTAMVAAVGLLAACGTPPSHFYHLTETPQPATAEPVAPGSVVPGSVVTAKNAPRRIVGIDSVTIPGYLDRPEFVLRGQGSRLLVKDFDRWGGPLDGMITRTLVQDLSAEMAATDVVELPVARDLPLSQVIEVAFDRFDADADGPAVLEARWRIFDHGGDRLGRIGRTTVREPVAVAGDPGATADALSRAVARLARDLASALRQNAANG